VAPDGWSGEDLQEAYVDPGTMVNSGQFDGMPSERGTEAISDFIEANGWGKRTVSYRIRDWLISRQRYWGAPIPVVYCSKCGTVPVPESELPVLLPEDAEFKPTGESPLKYHEAFVHTTCPNCGGPAQRETDTMDTFMCSNWYFYRYTSPGNDSAPFAPEKVAYWMPVDLYTGGAEHAVMHLLYARFFNKAIRDLGLVDFDEPFTHVFNQGPIMKDEEKEDDEGAVVMVRRRMSKSVGNVEPPDQYVVSIGADTVRCYLMFLGPWDQGGPWDDRSISGVSRWLTRVWKLALDERKDVAEPSAALADGIRRQTHKTIKRVAEDLEKFRFNTMLAALMEFTNYLSKLREERKLGGEVWREAIETLLLLTAPSAPHLAEELWERTGHDYSIHNQRFPSWDESLVAEDQVTLVIQVNGKLRDRVAVPVSIGESEARELALGNKRVQAHIENREVRNVVFVPGRLINVVVG
jgi:leucyl-tRNA synthetase